MREGFEFPTAQYMAAAVRVPPVLAGFDYIRGVLVWRALRGGGEADEVRARGGHRHRITVAWLLNIDRDVVGERAYRPRAPAANLRYR